MTKATLVVLLQIACTTGFSQNLSFQFGTPFRPPGLNVRWNVLTNSLPAQAWVYHLLPKTFSSSAISNLMALGPFTAKDIVRSNANEMLLKKPDGSSLWVSSRLGAIEYQPLNRYGPTNLAQHVPEFAQLPQLTTNLLNELGISIADIEKKPDGTPNFNFSEPLTEYYVNHAFITNIQFRAVGFRRAVDGASFVGNGTGGNCHLQFGENGKPSQIRLSWRNLERQEPYAIAAPEMIIKWIREGKAVQGMIRMDAESINWKTVKSVTITKAKLCYYAGDPFTPSDWLMPFVALWTTVDTGHGTIDVEIDSPVIDTQTGKPSRK